MISQLVFQNTAHSTVMQAALLTSQEGRTPLLIATFLDKVDTVEELLEFKANVNLEDNVRI